MSEVEAEIEAFEEAPASVLPAGFSVQAHSGNVEGVEGEWASQQ
jgi:hypothetical protein